MTTSIQLLIRDFNSCKSNALILQFEGIFALNQKKHTQSVTELRLDRGTTWDIVPLLVATHVATHEGKVTILLNIYLLISNVIITDLSELIETTDLSEEGAAAL